MDSINTDKANLSRWTALLSILIVGYFVFNSGMPFILNWDVFGHHAYLPMVFGEGKIVTQDLSYFETVNQQYHNTPTLYQFVLLENGNFMVKYTSGWAVLMLPFYCVAEIWAGFGGYPKDGFSFPYQTMTAIGAFTYFVLAVFILRKVLLRFFNDQISALVIVLLIFGTNFLFMQYASLGISHNLEFFLIALMLLLTLRFHEKITLGRGIQLGLVVGLIGLVRPPDLILGLIPLGWNYKQYGGLVSKIRFFLQQHLKITIITIVSILIAFSSQIVYWKMVSGSFFMNSYANNPGEGFDWFTPYILQVLFSFKKGWLLYTPLMIFAVIGIFQWRKKHPGQGNVALITFALFLFVVSCWTTWWYAESFSQRSMVDLYPLLAIALGFFLVYVQKSKARFFIFPLIGLFVALNLFQTYQITSGIIHGSRMTGAYYFSVFGQVSGPTQKQKALLSVDREALIAKGFNKEGFRQCFIKKVEFGKNYELNKDTIYTPTIDLLPSDISKKEYFWVISTYKYGENMTRAELEGKIFNTCVMYKGLPYNWSGQKTGDPAVKLDTIRKEVTFEYLTPHFRRSKDVLRTGIWNQSGPDLKVESVEIKAYESVK